MDEEIKKVKKSVDQKMDRLVRLDQKRDKKCERNGKKARRATWKINAKNVK